MPVPEIPAKITNGFALKAKQKFAISSNIIGCNEIIINELNGLLIPPKSTADLIVAMERFIEDPQLLNKTATMSRKHVAKLYEQEKVWQQTLAAYKAIVAN